MKWCPLQGVMKRRKIKMASNTTAQRSRSYRERIKSDPLKYAESLKKDRERYLKKKQQGVVKSVTEMPKREQRKMRRQWRISQRNRRRKWKMVSAVNSFMAHTTPPPSPDNMSVNAEDIPETPQLCEPTPERTPQRKRGRKKVAKAKAKVYRDLNDIKQKLEDALRKVEKYKKRSNRLKKNLGILESPKMKTKQQMQQESKQLKKTLLFHNTIMSEIRKKYQNVDNRKARQLISKLVAGKILKKYRLVTMAKKEFGFSTKLIRTNMTRADKLKYTRMETALGSPSSSTLTSTSQPIIDLHEGLIGSWCVVRYDGDPYPGIIQDVDPEGCALVRTMSHIGKNKFFWPMRDDVIWYRPEDVIRLVPEPQPVTKRHVMVEPTVWKEICSVLDHET
ncbi:uncharacterized protein LOC121537485 [Coregonus clupeaformis]|uniref:uncharacterized protein LOC121537485 n=1 Tax=Coregonus clupeaformis TaxID=59861 RepID=UPI001E1C914B|nr:uncharacterized protein LOC121537485 [Coregonus clupeaformis]